MKILHFVHGWFPDHTGGTEQYVLGLLRELRERGHTVAVVAGTEEAVDTADVVRDSWRGIPVYRVRRSGLFLESWYQDSNPDVENVLSELMDDLGPDLIHVHHWRRLSTRLVDLASRKGVPTVLTLHDTASTCARTFRVRNESFCLRDPIAENCRNCVERFWFQGDEEIDARVENYSAEMRRELDLATAVIAPSESLRSVIEKHYGSLGERIEVIPHPRLYASCETDRECPTSGSLRLAYWGALQPMKGVHLLLEALRRTADPDRFSLDIWGALDAAPDDYIDRLHELAEGLQVRFRGGFEPRDLPTDYDLAVFPSVALESWSFTVDEAFERGIPVLVPDRGAPAERWGCEPGIFQAEDASDLAGHIEALADDRSLLVAMQRRIPQRVTLEAHVDDLFDLYRWCEDEFEAPVESRLGSRLLRSQLMQATLRARDERLYELRGRADGDSEQARALKREVEERERVIEKKDIVLDEFNTNLGTLTRTLDERDRELEKLRNQMLEREAYLSYTREESEEVVEDQKKQLDAYRLSTDELHAAKNKLEEELRQARELIRSLEETAASTAGLRNELAAATDALSLGESERDSLLTSVQEHQDLVASLEGRLGVAEGQRSRLESEVRSLRRSILEKDEETARLEDRLREAERERARLAEAETRAAASQAELEAAESQCERLKALRDNLMTEIESESTRSGLAQDALQKALAEVKRLDERSSRFFGQVRQRLLPIAQEIAPEQADAAKLEELMDLVVANHGRLHTLITERDNVLTELINRIDDYEDKLGGSVLPTTSDRPSPADVARRLKSRVKGLSRKLKPRAQRQRKRILFVVHDFLPKHNAGTEIYTFNLATGLQADFDVHLLFCEARHEQPRYTVSKGTYKTLPYTEVVHNYEWESFEETYHDPRMEEIFENVLDEFDPDLVHIQHLHYFSFNFIPIAKTRGLPVVYTLHEFMLMCARGGQLLREDMEICELPVPEKCADCIRHQRLSLDYGVESKRRAADRVADLLPDNLKRAFEGYAGPRVPAVLDEDGRKIFAAAAQRRLDFIGERLGDVDLFISPSAFLRQKFIDSGMIRPDQIVHSDNGFDVSPFDNYRHKESETLRFGFVGTIAEYKGVHVLIEAMNGITADNVELQVWGDIETFVEYKARLLPLVQNSATRLMGRFDNTKIAEVLSEIDVLIVPSLWFENSPLTIHEAWLARVPLIVSDRGGMAELVDDGVGGFHFKLGDPDDLRNKMMHFVQDRSLVRAMGDRPGVVKTIADNVAEMKERYALLLEGARR